MATRCCCPPDSCPGRWLAALSRDPPSREAPPPAPCAPHATSAMRSGTITLPARLRLGIRLNAWNTTPDRPPAIRRQRCAAQPGHLGAVERDAAAGRRQQAGQAGQQRGLAASGRTEQHGQLPVLGREGQVAERASPCSRRRRTRPSGRCTRKRAHLSRRTPRPDRRRSPAAARPGSRRRRRRARPAATSRTRWPAPTPAG